MVVKLVEEYQAATREDYVSWDPTRPAPPPGGGAGLEPMVNT